MKNFQGEISSQSLVDVIQFYIQNQSIVKIEINSSSSIGEIWVNNGQIIHASTKKNFGIDAFYEMLGWQQGKFKIDLNVTSEVKSINKLWTELILEYYVLVDENQIQESTLEADFSDLNFEEPTPPKRSASSSGFKSIKEKIKTIMDLDGVIAASIVDISTGMPIAQDSKSNVDIESYCAYMVEVVKSHKKFLNKLNIKDKIEDIVINLNNNYHIVTFVLKQDNLFIYVVLDKENSNLGMTRIVLGKIEEELDL